MHAEKQEVLNMQVWRIKTRLQVYVYVMLFSFLLTSCAQSPVSTPTTKTASPSSTHVQPSPTVAVTPTSLPAAIPTPKVAAPIRYTSHVVLQGVGRPDDLAFDPQGRLLFSDEFNSTISRVNADGTVNLLLKDANGPEGLIVLPNGTIIFAEQETNRIVSLAPGSQTLTVVRTLPGIPGSANCKHGVDGIALDPTTNTLIVPDSPTGVVYRMSLDGKTLTTLASGIVRPVGAGVDRQGNIFIADECGNAIWRITRAGNVTRIGGFGMPDDVLPDGYGNVLVIDLQPAIHALIRLNLTTGKRETLARQGYIEPQGLAIDKQNNVFVSDDYANIIMKYVPEHA
jgi:sugar lactone lactonase YvrE